MKKSILILFLLPIFCSAQSVNNLDIKNGFLQFHFGDSLSKYKSTIRPDKIRPGYYHVSLKTVKLKRYLQELLLYFPGSTLEGIELRIRDQSDADFMNTAMKNAYGDGQETGDLNKNDPGIHKSFIVWNGQRVTATIEKMTYNLVLNGMVTKDVSETITFKRTGDSKIEGELDLNFQL